MSKDLVVQLDEMEKVVTLMVTGHNPTDIARKTGLSRAKVLEYIEANKKFAKDNIDIKERSREMLMAIDTHYGMLLKKLHYVIDEAEALGELKEITSAVKAAAQIEKDRSQLYSAAGVTADDELADQLAMMEDEHEKIKAILKDVSKDCPRCKAKIHRALSEIKGAPEVIVVEEPRIFEAVPESA